MDKYKNIIKISVCALYMISTHVNSQTSQDKAKQYAKQAILERLGEQDRTLTTEEQQIADEIIKSYLTLQKEYEESLVQLKMDEKLLKAKNQKNEILAKKLLELKQSIYTFFLNKNLDINDHHALDYHDELSNKPILTNNKTLENQIDNQKHHKDNKVNEK